ncbi:MAG: phosphotransferase [Pseudomonadota bacterium]
MIEHREKEDPRRKAGIAWLRAHDVVAREVVPASEDASFRRYFRVVIERSPFAVETAVLMDAPPAREDSRPFVQVAELLAAVGAPVPKVYVADLDEGFLLLEDLGATALLSRLTTEPQMVDFYYQQAGQWLHVMQSMNADVAAQRPAYDEAQLRREMQLFIDWLCVRHLHIELSDADLEAWQALTDLLVINAASQPNAFVHRDYHSRNLMVRDDDTLSIIDFQDAMYGPYTYDLVSLLRDCYVAWPMEQVTRWAIAWLDHSPHGQDVSQTQRLRWFFLMGVQRQLKAAGIFARLALRDDKWHYLPDVPRTLGYITALLSAYPELAWLIRLIEQRVLPRLDQ